MFEFLYVLIYIIIHINKYLKLNNDLVMLGSVMPDLTINQTHRLSHCRNNENGIKGLANPKIFIEKYSKDISNPIMIGYLIHLLTDEFFNRYIYEKYYIYDAKNNTIGLIVNGEKKYIDKNTIKNMKHNDFKLYDKYLLYKNKVCKFKDKKCFNYVKDIEIAAFDKKILKRYIKKANKDINIFNRINPLKKHNFQILNIDELNEQYIKCYNYIIKAISNIH